MQKEKISDLIKTKVWPDISDRLAVTFNMDAEFKAKFKGLQTAQLICAIPYLAGCKNSERIAMSHVAIYLLSITEGGKAVLKHNLADNERILNRLERISHFEDGDPKIIMRGLNLLAIQMVCGYQRDIEKDAKLNKYNPISAGVWYYEELREELTDKVLDVPCPEMDEIFDLNTAYNAFWGS